MSSGSDYFKSFKGKNVLVTGGSRGIGFEISKAFASSGAHVFIVYRSNDIKAKEVLDQLTGNGHKLFKCDVGNPDEVALLFSQNISKLDHLDIVINNAGIVFHHPIDDSSYDHWRKGWKKVLSVNLTGPANVCYQAAQIMIAQKSGHIINVTSRGAFRGEPEYPAYGASKAGLNSLTQSLAFRLAPYNIFVGAIAPGFVDTDMATESLRGSSGMQ